MHSNITSQIAAKTGNDQLDKLEEAYRQFGIDSADKPNPNSEDALDQDTVRYRDDDYSDESDYDDDEDYDYDDDLDGDEYYDEYDDEDDF